MKNKELKFGLEAKEAIKVGIDTLGNAVKATLGHVEIVHQLLRFLHKK